MTQYPTSRIKGHSLVRQLIWKWKSWDVRWIPIGRRIVQLRKELNMRGIYCIRERAILAHKPYPQLYITIWMCQEFLWYFGAKMFLPVSTLIRIPVPQFRIENKLLHVGMSLRFFYLHHLRKKRKKQKISKQYSVIIDSTQKQKAVGWRIYEKEFRSYQFYGKGLKLTWAIFWRRVQREWIQEGSFEF